MVVVDRDLSDGIDLFRCLRADDGRDVWTLRYAAIGDLDYGNSPRATPLITADAVYCLGAFGDLHCVDLNSGDVRWKTNIRDEYGATDKLVWGACSSPLIVDGKLIVNPGGKAASIVALDPTTGKVIWKTPGAPAAFGSFLAGTFGGRSQVIGYDQTTLGGWDVATGKRLWTLTPENPNDFNVPTPIRAGATLIVSTENNGTRQFRFRNGGAIDPKPVATNDDLAPDTHTPVLVGQRLFGIWGRLYCLDVANGLKTLWTLEDDAFSEYGTLVASEDRLLATSLHGEVLLIDPKTAEPEVQSRMTVFPDDEGVMSHPAFVGRRMYLRGSSAVCCVELT